MAVSVSNRVNFVQFEAAFTGDSQAEGLLGVFWNTNHIGLADERVRPLGAQTYRFTLPVVATNDLYTLSFRLDAFNDTSSTITITNIVTGFAGLEQAIDLQVFGNTSGAAILRLSAPVGYEYLLQSSTNLTHWAVKALLLSTNGTVFFSDSSATNSTSRFYRAVLP